MAISGQQNINIGAENVQVGSDSLYTAFTKTQDNFSKLFTNASPYSTFYGGDGISTATYSGNGTVTITNTGVTKLAAGTGISLNAETGEVIISASGNGNVGVTSVGLTSNSLTIVGNPIVSSGTFNVDLPMIETSNSFAPGDYVAASVTVNEYGIITAIANTASVGTVTSVALEVVGDGLSVTNSPITSNGIITIENTGVTRLNAGRGILLSGSTGELTISTFNEVSSGTVTLIDFFSNSLTITGNPVTTTGNVTIDLPNDITVSGNVTANTFIGDGSQLTNVVAGTATTAVKAGTVTTNAQPNITSVGTLSSLTVTGNITAGNLVGTTYIAGTLTSVSQPNITSVGTLTSLTVTGNVTANYFVGNGSTLSSITGSNVTGYVPNATNANTATTATKAGTVTTAAQPNITSVGTLTNVTVSGTVTTLNANVSGNLVLGNTAALLFNSYSDPTKQVALQSPDTIASGNLLNWYLPNTQGNVGEFLTNTGPGSELEWKTVAGTAPLANNSTGQAGQIAFDSGYVYVCIATNTWKRANLSTW